MPGCRQYFGLTYLERSGRMRSLDETAGTPCKYPQKGSSLIYPMSLQICQRSVLGGAADVSIRWHRFVLTDPLPRSTSQTLCSRNDTGHAVMNVLGNMHKSCIADIQVNPSVQKYLSVMGWLMHRGKSPRLCNLDGNIKTHCTCLMECMLVEKPAASIISFDEIHDCLRSCCHH